MAVAPKTPTKRPEQAAAGRAAKQAARTTGRTAPKNVEIVKAAYEAFARGSIPHVLEALDPKIEWHEAEESFPPPAGGGVLRGRDTVEREIFRAIPLAWQELKLVPEAYLESGDHVVVTGRFHGKPRSGGPEVQAPCVQVWTMRGGKAVRMRNYTDTARLARALGR